MSPAAKPPKPPFVRTASGALRIVATSLPTNLLERAAPIAGEPSPIAERAVEQHAIFRGRLRAFGVEPLGLEPILAPFASAVADLALVFPDGAFLLRPSEIARRAEVAALEALLAAHGIPVVGRVAAPGLFDGGDALFAGGTLFLGVPRQRASDVGVPVPPHGNALGREQVAAYARSAGLDVAEVAFSAAIRRLSSVAAAIADDLIVCGDGALDDAAFAPRTVLRAPRGEEYGAGVLALGGRRVIANLRFRETLPMLRANKVWVDAIDLWEFGKVGLTPSSLALVLQRT